MIKRLLPEDENFQSALMSIDGSVAQRELHSCLKTLIDGKLGGACVLEAGCGSGVFTKQLLRQSPTRVVAGDVNRNVLGRLEKFDSEILDVKFLDLRNQLEFADDSFDCVVCSSVLMHLSPEQSNQAIIEFSRVLRSNGNYLIAVLHEKLANSQYEQANEFGANARAINLPNTNTSIVEYYPEREHYHQAIVQAGLTFREIVVYRDDADGDQGLQAESPLWRVFTNLN